MKASHLRDRVRSLFKLNESPHRLALAFAAGVFIAFSPTIGLHTVTVFLLAWMFRLNAVVVFTGAFVNNPWTIVPIYGFCLWFGVKITGSSVQAPHIAWNTVGFADLLHLLRPYLWPFVAGTFAVGAAAAALSYGLFYWAVARYRKLDAR